MIRFAILASVSASFALAIAGQSANAPAFEVASIRLHQGRTPNVGFKPSGSRFDVSAVSIQGMIMYAYDLKSYQVTGGPGWANSDAWDISAKAPGEGEPSREQFKQMMRQLLADRFSLAFHREAKETAVWALIVGKGKVKLKLSADGAQSMLRMSGNQMTVTKGGMDQLASQLSGFPGIDRPVIDKTGLSGAYDYTLMLGEGRPGDEGDVDALLDDQLGLRLTPQKAPLEVLIIDHAEKPSEN